MIHNRIYVTIMYVYVMRIPILIRCSLETSLFLGFKGIVYLTCVLVVLNKYSYHLTDGLSTKYVRIHWRKAYA